MPEPARAVPLIWDSKLGVSGGVLRGQFLADIFSLLFFKVFPTFLDDHNVTMEIKPISRAESRSSYDIKSCCVSEFFLFQDHVVIIAQNLTRV